MKSILIIAGGCVAALGIACGSYFVFRSKDKRASDWHAVRTTWNKSVSGARSYGNKLFCRNQEAQA